MGYACEVDGSSFQLEKSSWYLADCSNMEDGPDMPFVFVVHRERMIQLELQG